MAAIIDGFYTSKTDQANGVTEVVGHEDGSVRFRPQGGGTVYRAPESEFLEHFRKLTPKQMQDMAATYLPKLIDGDWFDDDHKPIPGFVNSERWNGFLCPYFQKKDIDEAIADGRISNVIWVDDQKSYVMFVDLYGEGFPEEFDLAAAAAQINFNGPDQDAIDYNNLETDYVIYRPERLKVDRKTYTVFSIGAASWTWQMADEPEVEPTAGPSI
jgi:hypothetical protein